MFRFASPVTLRLARGQLLSWQQGRVQLRVVSGAVWVTRPNDLADHFLHPGRQMELHQGLIGAEQDAVICLEAAERSWARMLGAAWPRVWVWVRGAAERVRDRAEDRAKMAPAATVPG